MTIDGKKVQASGHSFELSNTGKVLFPDDGITKGELVEYYAQVADAMLPYLKDRPIAMGRYPDGITKQRIFQKNPGKYFPDWITSVEVKKEGGTLRHVVCDQAATLVYLANQAVIEFHVFLSGWTAWNAPTRWWWTSTHPATTASTRPASARCGCAPCWKMSWA